MVSVHTKAKRVPTSHTVVLAIPGNVCRTPRSDEVSPYSQGKASGTREDHNLGLRGEIEL